MDYLLGVDGGNTKTIALLARPDGAIVGAARGGCGDIYGAGGAEGAFESMRAAVHGALAAAGAPSTSIRRATFSLAGADWLEDFTYIRQELLRHGITQDAQVVNDAIGALRAGTSGAGVSLVVGTGTAIGARGIDGRVWHISFWLWEAHGAGELGRQVLRALTRAELGLDPPAPLAAHLCQALGAASVEDLLYRLTRHSAHGGSNLRMRQLAPALLAECERGDPTAQRLVQDFGVTLGDYVLAAARQVGIAERDFDLVLAGGVLRANSACLIDTVVQRVQASAPGARPVRASLEPAVGALLLACESASVNVDERWMDTLRLTLPPASLYATDV
jgi:N-acetylglucosamine kinase-like BadF-type ATPase